MKKLFPRFMMPAVFPLVFRVLTGFAASGVVSLAHAEDWSGLYFDLNSLVWMLIGAIGWGGVSFWLGWRSCRRAVIPPPQSLKPVLVKPAEKSETITQVKDTGNEETNPNPFEYLTPLDETTTVTVEEMSDIAEQVELFLILGRQEMAIRMLLARIGSEEESDPRIWFKLLDIYYSRQDRPNFDKLANDIRVRFNVALPSWEDSTQQAEGRHGLERFPHLLARISECWGTSTSLAYLKSLVKDNRSGERAGFDEDAFREVMLLIGILEQGADSQ